MCEKSKPDQVGKKKKWKSDGDFVSIGENTQSMIRGRSDHERVGRVLEML